MHFTVKIFGHSFNAPFFQRQLREAGIVKDRVPKGTSCVGIGSRSWFGIFQPKVTHAKYIRTSK